MTSAEAPPPATTTPEKSSDKVPEKAADKAAPPAAATTPPAANAATPASSAPTAPGGHAPATPKDAHAPAHDGPPSAKAAKVKKILASIVSVLKGFKSLPKDFILGIKDGILSGGWPMRLAVLGFGICLLIVVKTGQKIWGMYQKEAKQHFAASHLDHDEASQKEKAESSEEDEEIVPSHGFFIERMVGSLVAPLGESKSFEIDLYIECDDEETKNILESRRHALQEQIEHALQGRNPDQLMTEKGKQELKDQVLKQINQLLEKEFKDNPDPPKAVRIFFTRFVLA